MVERKQERGAAREGGGGLRRGGAVDGEDLQGSGCDRLGKIDGLSILQMKMLKADSYHRLLRFGLPGHLTERRSP